MSLVMIKRHVREKLRTFSLGGNFCPVVF